MDALFDAQWGEDKSPVDTTDITQVSLFFSQEEAAEFKALAKKAMIAEYGLDYQKIGNLSDLLLKILTNIYGTKNIPAQEHAEATGI